jgi:hypothetical protein
VNPVFKSGSWARLTRRPDISQVTPSCYAQSSTDAYQLINMSCPRGSGGELVEVDVEERIDLHSLDADMDQPHPEPPRVVESAQ